MKKKDQLRTRMQGKLYRDPDNPFVAWDEEGRPCLPMTIDDDSPSNRLLKNPCIQAPPMVEDSYVLGLPRLDRYLT
jgi:hypothetical protein